MLEDAFLKIDRADKHIADLETVVADYLRSDFYEILVERDKRTGQTKVGFKSLHPIGKELNLLFGDAVGNLRSALDYAVVAICAPHRAGKTGGIYFPFADDRSGYIGEVTKGHISLCGTLMVDFFVNEVQAHKGGTGHRLWALNKLRNIEKHRMLLASTKIAGLIVNAEDANGNRFGNIHAQVNSGGTVAMFNWPDLKLTEEPRPTFQIEITEPDYFTKERLPETLMSLSQYVRSTVEGINALIS